MEEESRLLMEESKTCPTLNAFFFFFFPLFEFLLVPFELLEVIVTLFVGRLVLFKLDFEVDNFWVEADDVLGGDATELPEEMPEEVLSTGLPSFFSNFSLLRIENGSSLAFIIT